eukprot:363539-Chlamydomonas_euryale.AAC.3
MTARGCDALARCDCSAKIFQQKRGSYAGWRLDLLLLENLLGLCVAALCLTRRLDRPKAPPALRLTADSG